MTSEAIQTSHRTTAATYTSQSIFSAVRGAWKAVRKHAEHRRAERALRAMEPRMLKDIGIDRSEIMSIVYTGKLDRRS